MGIRKIVGALVIGAVLVVASGCSGEPTVSGTPETPGMYGSVEAPTVFAFGLTHSWSDGSNLKIDLPKRFTPSDGIEVPEGTSAIGLVINIRGSVGRSIDIANFSFDVVSDGVEAEPFLDPAQGVNGASTGFLPPNSGVEFVLGYFVVNDKSSAITVTVTYGSESIVFTGGGDD